MFIIKRSFVVLVLFELWNSSGTAPCNSDETVTVATNEDVFTSLSDSEATTADSVTELVAIGCNGTVCDEHASCLDTAGELKCTCDNSYQGDGLNCYATAETRDCADIRVQGHTTSGVYTVFIGESLSPLSVYCDMTTGSVGWTVFQRRQDGSVDFHLNWADYQKGFGNIGGEFWIGNDNLHLLTSSKRYKLRVELTAFDGSTAFAEYDDFKVASAANKYRLTSVGKYSGTAGDALRNGVGVQFSTKDQDNDWAYYNCAVTDKGAWWYNHCHFSNLNGFYYKTQTDHYSSVNWKFWKNNQVSLKRTEMKLTPFVQLKKQPAY